MPIDDAFGGGTSAVLLDMAQRPQAPKPQAPAFSMWATTKAAPKGLAAGAAQGIGSTADVLGAFGDVLGSFGDAGGQGMFGGLSDQERKDSNAAREKLMTDGVNFNSEVGRSFRNVGKDYLPDPVTAHGAEQAVGNLFRLGGKAIAAGALLGPYGGAALAGAEEGFTASDELGQQGVDLGTRTKVGFTKGALTAASFALPAAGATWQSTVGLALAGGPVSFIAENAATRAILENANYSKLAEQYDPFDPAGLALSTLLPLGFGALAMRGARGGKGKVDADAPKSHPDPEIVDAARVNLLRENIDNTRLTDPQDLAGGAAHSAAVSRAIDQMAAGERVAVSDIAPAGIAARVAEELQPRLARAMDEIGPTARVLDEPPPVRAEPPVAMAPKVADAAEPGPTQAAQPAFRLVSEAPEIDRAANLIEADRPDMMVQLDGMDAPVRMADLMRQIREDLGRDLQEAPLIEAAAACFVS